MTHGLDAALVRGGGELAEVRGLALPQHWGDVEAEYEAASHGAGLLDRRDRGLVEVTGRDRAAWLHNLLTNAVKTLQPGDGNYAFAINVKGRILFDCNIFVMADAIWLDLDRRLVPKATTHLDRYAITEDVHLKDLSAGWGRIGLVGPKAAEIADALGATHAAAMATPSVSTATLVQKSRPMARTDAFGVFTAELFVPDEDLEACWNRLLEIGRPVGLRPVGWAASEALRIESGIPAYGQDIDEDVLPAETGQIERAVSFVKGCYLGQEVVERMRSHGAVARRLVSFRVSGGSLASLPVRLVNEQGEAGRLTSCCVRPRGGESIGLGYVKSALARPGIRLRGDSRGQLEVEVLASSVRAASGG